MHKYSDLNRQQHIRFDYLNSVTQQVYIEQSLYPDIHLPLRIETYWTSNEVFFHLFVVALRF